MWAMFSLGTRDRGGCGTGQGGRGCVGGWRVGRESARCGRSKVKSEETDRWMAEVRVGGMQRV